MKRHSSDTIRKGDAVVAYADPERISLLVKTGTYWARNVASEWWCEDEGVWFLCDIIEGTVLASYAGMLELTNHCEGDRMKTVPIIVIEDHSGFITECRSDLYVIEKAR